MLKYLNERKWEIVLSEKPVSIVESNIKYSLSYYNFVDLSSWVSVSLPLISS
jgi:hypothetical protein